MFAPVDICQSVYVNVKTLVLFAFVCSFAFTSGDFLFFLKGASVELKLRGLV